MTTPNYPGSPSSVGSSTPTTGTTGTSDVAKDQAKQTAGTAAEESKHVASVAKDEAQNVAAEAKYQARNLMEEAKSQVDEQSRSQRDRAVSTLSDLSDQLEQMARGEGAPSGMAQDLVRQVADRARSISTRIENREPTELLDDLRSYARRKPGTFLLSALAAGMVAGRVTRGAKEASSNDDRSSDFGYRGGSVYDNPRGTAAGYPTAGTGYPETQPAYTADRDAGLETATGTVPAGSGYGDPLDPTLGTTTGGLGTTPATDSPWDDNPNTRGTV